MCRVRLGGPRTPSRLYFWLKQTCFPTCPLSDPPALQYAEKRGRNMPKSCGLLGRGKNMFIENSFHACPANNWSPRIQQLFLMPKNNAHLVGGILRTFTYLFVIQSRLNNCFIQIHTSWSTTWCAKGCGPDSINGTLINWAIKSCPRNEATKAIRLNIMVAIKKLFPVTFYKVWTDYHHYRFINTIIRFSIICH